MSIQQYADAVVAFVAANQAWAIPIVFLLAFGESLAFLSLLLPSTVILLGISALLGAGGIAFWPLWVTATIGATLGYAVSYWIGLYFKDEVAGWWPFRDRPELLPRGQQFFDKYGALGVFFGHFFGPVRAVVPVVAGIYAMRQLPFQLANTASAAIWSATVLSPNLIATYWQPIKAYISWLFGPIVRLFGAG